MDFTKFALRIGIAWCTLYSAAVLAEDQAPAGTRCIESSVVSVPSRPTVSNSTDTTHCGVVEVEYGWEQLHQTGLRQSDVTGGLRLGLAHNLDFHWASTEFFQVAQAGRDDSGLGDNWLGLKYRFSRQTNHVPSFGIFYQAKVPSPSANLGTGYVDHAISFLASKDVRKLHFDFNVTPILAGSASGLHHKTGLTLSSSLPLSRKLSLVTEAYGYTQLDRNDPAYSSMMAGFTYQSSSRLIFDAGVDLGVTHDAPHRRVYAGITYAIGNAFSWARGEMKKR